MNELGKIFTGIGIVFSIIVIHSALTMLLGDIYINAIAVILILVPIVLAIKFVTKLINK